MFIRKSVQATVLAGSLALCSTGFVYAQDSTLSLNAEAVSAFDAAVADHAERGLRSGYAAIISSGSDVHVTSAGYRDIENAVPFTADTLVRIASMSKPVTAVAVMMLVEDGLLTLETPVGDILPAFAATQVVTTPSADADGNFTTTPQTGAMTVRHLMTHTSGLGYIFDRRTDLGASMIERSLYNGPGNLEAKMDELATMPLYFQPGDRWMYSYSNDVLGRVIEVVSGQSFEDYLDANIFAPLGMIDSGFVVREDQRDRLSVLYMHNEDGDLVRPYSDDNPEPVQGWASGGGGMLSTANDYSRFVQMLVNGGALDGHRYLETETLASMTRPQVEASKLPPAMNGLGYGYGFGVVLPPAEGQRALGIPGDYSWRGFFDTDFLVSPATGAWAVMMTQELPGQYLPAERTAAWWRPAFYATLPQ
ncbi:MAG: serine hydrolase [Maricaulis sp.]|nr:serine hydrolase [Maricaulis sp.]MDG2044648.1 serine hydrolase [Maricaulis sp.]